MQLETLSFSRGAGWSIQPFPELDSPRTLVIAFGSRAFDEDPTRGDHAAKWETSILSYLRPELVDMGRLTDGRNDPLKGIYGQDPRMEASPEVGRETVEEIVRGITRRVEAALESSIE